MFWFALFYFVNAVAPHNSVIYNDNFRIVIGGMPLNILDGLLLLCGLASLFPTREPFPIPRKHIAWSRGMIFLVIAGLVGVVQSMIVFPDLPPRFLLPPIRNFILVPACLFIGYRCLSSPRQFKTAFLIVFVSSVGSAVASILTQGIATSALATASRADSRIDVLRQTALDVSGDAGLLAMCVILFAMAAHLQLFRPVFRYGLMTVCAAGMFLIPHRSSWLLCVLVCAYAGFIMWPRDLARKLFTTTTSFILLVVVGVALLIVAQSQTDRDFMKWTGDRLASLLPGEGDSAHSSKAWDTRMPAMLMELELFAGDPVLGRGFAAQEWNAIEVGQGASFRHTPWISTLCETGLLGFAGFLFVIVGLAVVGTRMARDNLDRWYSLLGAFGASWGVFCILVGFMTLSWNSPRQAITLGLLAGLIFRARDLALASQQQQLPLQYAMAGSQYGTVPA